MLMVNNERIDLSFVGKYTDFIAYSNFENLKYFLKLLKSFLNTTTFLVFYLKQLNQKRTFSL